MLDQKLNPEVFFGAMPGSDRVMLDWHSIVNYFYALDAASDRILVTELGKSMEGKLPFIAAFISSPENLKNLNELKKINHALADPRGHSQNEIASLAEKGRGFCIVSMSLHSNEVGGTQASPLMAYEMITREDEEMEEIRDHCVTILVPCSNPDGEMDFYNWYQKYFGTFYEGSCSPHLRHKYAGHSNNRDGVYVNLDETLYLNRLLMEYKPQAFLDHHHQSPWMERLTITPGTNPISPECSALQMRELRWYAEGMAKYLARYGVRGVVTADEFYDNWCYPVQQDVIRLQNIAGVLAESADALIATPVYVPREKLKAHTIPCIECPDPWEGGWWGLSDIVHQQILATYGMLHQMAHNSQDILTDMTRKAFEQIRRGENDEVRAYVIPKEQHDPSVLNRLLHILDLQDIEYGELAEPMNVGGIQYPAGSYLVPLDQPYYAMVKMMLGKTVYPLDHYTEKPNGDIRISDAVTLNITDMMGLKCYPVGEGSEWKLTKAQAPALSDTLIASRNDSYTKANALIDEGKTVYRDANGDFTTEKKEGCRRIFFRRIGILKTGFTGNSEEGYTRLVLERTGFPYRIVTDREIRENKFSDIDLLIIPGDTEETLRMSGEPNEADPPEYARGFGEIGPKNLRQFVKNGGRVVAWETACYYTCEAVGMPVEDTTRNLPKAKLNAYGSMLRVVYEKDELTYGMPYSGFALYRNGPVFRAPGWHNEVPMFHTLARYAKTDLLADGFLIGEQYLSDMPCVMRVESGKGDVVVMSFDPKFRMQTDGTFKLLFNALYRYDSENTKE